MAGFAGKDRDEVRINGVDLSAMPLTKASNVIPAKAGIQD